MKANLLALLACFALAVGCTPSPSAQLQQPAAEEAGSSRRFGDPFSNAQAYGYTQITTATTTLIKTGAGYLRRVCVNTLVASATIKIDDAVTDTTPRIGILTNPSTITAVTPYCQDYEVVFTIGLTIVTSGATDVSVIWK